MNEFLPVPCLSFEPDEADSMGIGDFKALPQLRL